MDSLQLQPYVFNLIKMRLTEWEVPFTEDEINKLIEKGKDLFPNFKWNIEDKKINPSPPQS